MKEIKLKKTICIIVGICLSILSIDAQSQQLLNDFKKLANGGRGDISMSAYPKVSRKELNIPVKYEGKRYDLVKDFHASNKNFENVSSTIQKAIDKISQKGGGMLYIPAGEYGICRVSMKSNVHIIVSNKAVLKGINEAANGKSYSFFDIGNNGLCENVSIEGENGQFKVLIPDYKPGIRFTMITEARNFFIADLLIEDHDTKFSGICLGATKKTAENVKANFCGPTNGVIMDCSTYNSDYGYGMIQAQAAQNVRFYNLYGEGGATLRLETGYTKMNNLQWGGVFDITAKNIMCVRGNSALMVSPHSMHCGYVHISDVTAVSAGFAARIDGGFISKKYEKRDDIIVGTFKGGDLKNVTAYFGTQSQLKTKHLGFLPTELVKLLPKPNHSTVMEPAPSACPVVFDAKYPFNLDTTSIVAIGYKYAQNVMTEPHKLSAEALKIKRQ